MAKKGSRKTGKTAPPLRVVSGGRGETASQDEATKATSTRRSASKATQGKRVQFDRETWQAIDLLGRDRMMTFQELADEAFRDLLSKHGRPFDLKDALKRSALAIPGNENAPKRRKR